jgi:nucleotide-binding universal stress UspA family protein
LVLGRRGHDGFSWLVIGTVLGPLALLLAIDAVQNAEPREPIVVATGQRGGGATDVLVGADGSAESRAALETAVALFGASLGRVTLVRVISYDSGLESSRDAAAAVEEEAARYPQLTPRVEVVRGHPAAVLAARAVEGDYDVLVVGTRGAGRHLFGSAARELAAGSPVPVFLVGAAQPTASTPSVQSASGAGAVPGDG